MSRKLIKSVFWLLFGLLGSTAAAESPPFTREGTLGKHMEGIYSQLMKGCFPEQAKIVKKTCGLFGCSNVTEPISVVPAILQNQSVIKLDSKVLWNDRQSLARTFALVYPDRTQFGKPASGGEAWLLYKKGLDSSEGNLIPKGMTSGMVMHDCGAALTGLAEANAGLDLPLAQFKTALKASYGGGTKKSVAVFFGQFESPFFRMWNSAVAEEQVQAIMWLYDWYSRAAYNNEYLLSSINAGITAFNVEEENRDSSGKLDLNGAISAGIFNAKANSVVSVSNGASSRLNEFKVAVALNGAGEPDITFLPLPPPAELVRRMKLVVPQVDETSIIPAVPGSRVTHKVSIKGIPPEYCSDSRNLWYVSAKDRSNAPNLVSYKSTSLADGTQVCDFMLEYSVPGKYASPSADDEFTLAYAIRGVHKPAEKNGAQYDAEFAEVRVRYPVNRSPEIFTPPTVVDPTIIGASLAWQSNLIIREDSVSPGSSIDWTKSFTSTVAIFCGADQPLSASSSFTPNATRKTGDVNFNLLSNDNDELRNWKAGLSNPKQCSAKGTIKFPTRQAGIYLVREYSVPIHFPRVSANNVESTPTVATVLVSDGQAK